MNKSVQYITCFLSSVLAFTACSKEDVDIPIDQKTPIQLSVGVVDDGAMTRTVITDGTGKTKLPFAENTRLHVIMESEKKVTEGTAPYKNISTYCTAAGVSNPEANSKSNVSYVTGYTRYWDDAFARDAQIRMYALAVPGKTNSTKLSSWNTPTANSTTSSAAWTDAALTEDSKTISWTIGNGAVQNSTTIADDDLCFSNNHGTTILDFDNTNKTFDKADLIFYHALSKFTVKIKCGDGYKADGSDFKFTDCPSSADNSFSLNGFNGSGTFNVAEGEFTGTLTPTTYSSIYLKSTTKQKAENGEYYVLEAYVISGTDMTSSDVADAFSFTIDKNSYKVSKLSLYNAIKANASNIADGDVKTSVLGEKKKLLAGVNYEFTFKVGKTKIDAITASVVDWETVTAEIPDPTNARITVTGLADGTHIDGFSLYRTKDANNSSITDSYEGYNWDSNYEKGTLTPKSENVYSTNWYWDDNTSYYHFRAVKNQGDADVSNEGTPHISLISAESFKDILWGAPFVSPTDKFTYSTENGFDGTGTGHQIYKAIGPTNDPINLTMFHMMSKVIFNIQTTTGDDKVTLGTGTKITLKNVNQSGTVAMGNGLVSTVGTATDWTFTQTPTTPSTGIYQWTAGIVPQSLDDVILVITTPDDNQYEIALKDVTAASVTANNISISGVAADEKVTYWYPCFEYTYTITLKKTGIENITATLVDWQKVEATYDNVQIK